MIEPLDITELGATGDGRSLETSFIQQAIDQCASGGGGTVKIPSGTYVTGTLYLKDNITLHLAKDALLLGSPDIDQYENPDPYVDAVGQNRGWALIAAIDCENIAITGKGTIDGRGEVFAGTKQRPMLLRFVRSSGIRMEGVTLLNSGAWVSHYFCCRDIRIEGVTIRSHCNKNNDGIDIDSCSDVTITGCTVDTGDDAICIKTTCAEPCRNVEVTDCDLSSNWGTLKLGTESMGDMEHMRFSNCRIHKAGGGGIKVLSADGANIRDIVFADIVMEDCDTAVFMQLGRRMRTYRPDDPTLQPGSIRNITVRNVQVTMRDETRVTPATGIFLTGNPDQMLENVALENIMISLPGGGTSEDAQVHPPLRETEYPECMKFGVLPASGLYARHCRNLTLTQLEFSSRNEDERLLQFLENTDGPDSEN